MEPVLSGLLSQTNTPSKVKQTISPKWHEIYDQIPVDVSIEWDAFELSVRDLFNLEVDDVIELNPEIISKTKARIEDRTCFTGEIGLTGDQVAYQVNECMSESLNLIGKSYG